MSVTDVEKDLENLTLTVVAHFDAPVEKAWQLWSDPRKLERWWGPPDYPATVLAHPALVQLRKALVTDDQVVLVLEHVPGVSLERLVELLGDDDPERSEMIGLELELLAGTAGLGRSTAVLVVEDDDRDADCRFDGERLCLAGGRFRVEAEWRDPSTGGTGVAPARRCGDASAARPGGTRRGPVASTAVRAYAWQRGR